MKTISKLVFEATSVVLIIFYCSNLSAQRIESTPQSEVTDPQSLTPGEYFVTQSWAQEESFERPYHVRVPKTETKSQQFPVLVFLHGNGADAQEAMRGFLRIRKEIASRYVTVFPQGYRESWNIVSERSKADDLRFIESIVRKLSTFNNVDPYDFTIMGASNGAALVNQLAIESRLPNIRNYISGVSQLNVWQYDGKNFKAKGEDNRYRQVAYPLSAKRLLNISGLNDQLVPYRGGPSNVIPANNGKLAFLDAEESTFVWARQMGYEGKKLNQPSRIIDNVEAFSYLEGNVVHYKVTNEGHGATHGIGEQLLLDFLDAGQEVNEEIREVGERIQAALLEQRRFERLKAVNTEKIKLLRELRQFYASIHLAESRIEHAEESDQVEITQIELEQLDVRVEIINLKLEMIEKRYVLEQLASEVPAEQQDLKMKAEELLEILDAANRLTDKFGEAMLENQHELVEELESKFVELERVFDRQHESLQLRFELIEARRDGDEEWIHELEMELEELDSSEDRDEEQVPAFSETELPKVIRLTSEEVSAAAQLNFNAEILPRLKNACFECHDQDSSSGDLDLESLVEKRPFVVNRIHWLNVIEQLKVRSMPPTDARQPSDEDRRVMLGWLTNAIENFDYETIRRAGVIPAKRLTHDEYNNTIRDLVGIDLRPADRFPSDLTASSGFENSATSLFIQPVTMERYVGAAESIVQSAWPSDTTSSQHDAARKRLIGELQDFNSVDDIKQIIDRFASRAYRRPVLADELASLMNHFEHRQNQGASAESALRGVLQVILISPSFLIRAESPPPSTNNIARISDWDLASRLSYFLWGSMPDDELFGLARTGQLHQPDVLVQQVDRMLSDSKSETLGHLFAAQWLGFQELDRVQRDQIDNPWATDSLVEAMKDESAMLFNSLVQRNASIDRLLDADYTFVNEELANHYRIEGVSGSHLREVSLEDNPRRGVLGHASILATTSFPRRTSPVLRGNWILTTLLGTPPPPPPPNISEFDEGVADNDRLSQRQKLEQHRTNPRCYACHSQIDPLGFALEEFEWFGRYRPQQRGKPVDSVGTLPSGSQFRGLKGLSETLLKERIGDLAEQVTRKMLAYALGRQLHYYDEATVNELTTALMVDQRRVRTLILAIIQSETFQSRQL